MDTMKMVCRKNSLFVISIYYDMRGQSVITSPKDSENLSRFLQMIEVEFQMKYGSIYLEQQPIIASLDTSNVSPRHLPSASPYHDRRMSPRRSVITSFHFVKQFIQ